MKLKAMLLAFVSFHAFVLAPLAPVFAQDFDISAPEISHQVMTGSAPGGEALKIQAKITDDVAVSKAKLFYRPLGDPTYKEIPMKAGRKGRYTATIPKKKVIEPGVEYYIQAEDTAGNIAQRGFAFSPLMVTVAPFLPSMGEEPEVIVEAPAQEDIVMTTGEASAKKAWYKKWWVWTIVGAAAIGAAAAGGGGGGGGDSAPAPTTGSVSIVGPTP